MVSDEAECNEHERDGHKHHRKHEFKILDRLDGAKDHVTVIASLPPRAHLRRKDHKKDHGKGDGRGHKKGK